MVINETPLSKYFKKRTTDQNDVKSELNLVEENGKMVENKKKKLQSVSIDGSVSSTMKVYSATSDILNPKKKFWHELHIKPTILFNVNDWFGFFEGKNDFQDI